jgi:hypothetical protein
VNSPAQVVFDRLVQQVDEVKAAAGREQAAGHTTTGPVLLRSAIVLTVAAFDTYVHERGLALLRDYAARGNTEAQSVATFLGGGVTPSDVSGASAELFIRYRLSYRTLVAPNKVDEVFKASDVDHERTWLLASIAMGSRPDRVRALVQLPYDRRNQIAHEGDWDSVALDFRPIEQAHVDDCVSHLRSLVTEFDKVLH